MRLLFAFATLACAAAPALAETVPVTAPVAAPRPAPMAKPVKICRISQEPTGSHMGGSGRVCRTAEAWARIDQREASGASNSVAPVQSGAPTME